jgi:hypothetical protein
MRSYNSKIITTLLLTSALLFNVYGQTMENTKLTLAEKLLQQIEIEKAKVKQWKQQEITIYKNPQQNNESGNITQQQALDYIIGFANQDEGKITRLLSKFGLPLGSSKEYDERRLNHNKDGFVTNIIGNRYMFKYNKHNKTLTLFRDVYSDSFKFLMRKEYQEELRDYVKDKPKFTLGGDVVLRSFSKEEMDMQVTDDFFIDQIQPSIWVKHQFKNLKQYSQQEFNAILEEFRELAFSWIEMIRVVVRKANKKHGTAALKQMLYPHILLQKKLERQQELDYVTITHLDNTPVKTLKTQQELDDFFILWDSKKSSKEKFDDARFKYNIQVARKYSKWQHATYAKGGIVRFDNKDLNEIFYLIIDNPDTFEKLIGIK